MKYIISTLSLLLVGLTAVAEEPQSRGGAEYRFFSTLSAPIASFRKVETKDCYPLYLDGVEMNVGSANSPGGTVNIYGNPVYIDKLYMENGTTFGVGSAKWIVDNLAIGQGGTVTVGTLLANTINSDAPLNLTATQLWTEGDVYVDDAVITGGLLQSPETGPRFAFSSTSTPTRNARFEVVPKTSQDTVSDVERYYLIMADQ